MYGLISSFKAHPGKRDALAAEDPADVDVLWITEVWESAAAVHKASLQLPAVRTAIAAAMPLIAAFGEHRGTRVAGGFGLQWASRMSSVVGTR